MKCMSEGKPGSSTLKKSQNERASFDWEMLACIFLWEGCECVVCVVVIWDDMLLASVDFDLGKSLNFIRIKKDKAIREEKKKKVLISVCALGVDVSGGV